MRTLTDKQPVIAVMAFSVIILATLTIVVCGILAAAHWTDRHRPPRAHAIHGFKEMDHT